MKRDDDLIRTLLLEFEAEDDWLIMLPGTTKGASEEDRLKLGHIYLLMDSGLMVRVGNSTARLTAQGHDFLKAIHDDNIWKKTRDGAAAVGGLTLGLLKDLAVGYLKQELAEKTGIQI
ncbi:DUF2513 domain-containing protein [Mesobacterium pallidum]|uniref:DUF2513 domain-containing protein n=1 Tax=Mesobacterium pallidum TaxID=2872037 RepID=UPI001EE34400